MSYDEELATRIRRCLADRTDVVEKKMFGGLCFMVGGAMCCGLTKTDFMVRVGPEQYDDALAQPHARPMDFTGRPLKGMVYVAPAGLQTDVTLASWIRRGLSLLAGARAAPKKERRRKSGRATGNPRGSNK
jgi:TfoX/Sxy family transcriptional regulator of competence genes